MYAAILFVTLLCLCASQYVSGHVVCRAEREACQRLVREYDLRKSLLEHVYDTKFDGPKMTGKICLDYSMVKDCVDVVQSTCPSTGLNFPALTGIKDALSVVCSQLRKDGSPWKIAMPCIASVPTVGKADECHSEAVHHRETDNTTGEVQKHCQFLTSAVSCSIEAVDAHCGPTARDIIAEYGGHLLKRARWHSKCDKGLTEGEMLLITMATGTVLYVIICLVVAVLRTRPSDRVTWRQCGAQFAEMCCCLCVALFRVCSTMKTHRKPRANTTCGYQMQRL